MAVDLQFLHQIVQPSCLLQLRQVAQRFPDDQALVHADQSLSYNELMQRVAAVRRALQATLPADCHRVLLLVPNSLELVLLQLALLEEGRQLALADVRTKSDVLGSMVDLFQPDVLIETPVMAAVTSELRPDSDLLHVAAADLTVPDAESVEAPAELKEGAELVYFRHDRLEAWQGAIFPIESISSTVQLVRQLFSLHRGDAVLCHMSGGHYLALSSMILPALCSCGKLVILDRDCPQAEVLDAIELHNPKLMIHYRAYFWLLHKAAQERKEQQGTLGTLQFAVVNADSPSLPFRSSWEELFNGHLLSGFATTFAGSFLTLNLSWLEIREGFVGKALPGVELRIEDESGHERPNGRWGEILFTSQGQARRFLDNPEGNPELGEDGWLRTQQMAMRNTDAFLTLADEVVDVIWVHGFKVSPVEIEEPLLEQPGILDCAAVNAPRSSSPDQVQLFVVSDTDDDGQPVWNAERLLKVCERIYPPYLRPGSFHLIDEIPYDDEEIKLRKELKYRMHSAEPWRSN